ncbi:ribbon-helix-helix protein, CopG family [Candidatus Berkiella aquae]|uniref:Ribbon-helix-helix domain-containing protein n=1 Tax=Candidatus Berkiella aquae TaxID=295108 RepID=A0A0Q9YUB0_9GAMM|nr:ribbon-helix-helix protein, CopG family [Candidatus Berkiella aquae]MCS5709996.1 ribbon-helix-helix domain-containing protein [Candidatus Berkiella aquae]
MSKLKKVSLDMSEKNLKKIDKIAKLTARSRAYIINELIDNYLDELIGFYIASQRLRNTPESEYIPIHKTHGLIQQKRESRDK